MVLLKRKMNYLNILTFLFFIHPSLSFSATTVLIKPFTDLNEEIRKNETLEDIDTPICLSLKEGYDYFCARFPSEDSKCTQDTFAYHLESCVNPLSRSLLGNEKSSLNEEEQTLFNQIIHLEKDSNLDENLQNKYIGIGKNNFAEALVAHRTLMEWEDFNTYKKNAETQSVDYWRDSEIQIAFKDKIIKLIAESGFKNNHETKTSNGCNSCGYARLKIESNLIGLNELKENSIYPKYAYFVPFLNKKGTRMYVPRYGNIIGVAKNLVKRRSTYTRSDSLDYRKSINHENFINIFYNYNPIKKSFFSKDYMETQIFGSLQFSDLKYLLVNCFEYEQNFNSDRIEEIVKLTQIPVYICDQKKLKHGVVFIPMNKNNLPVSKKAN